MISNLINKSFNLNKKNDTPCPNNNYEHIPLITPTQEITQNHPHLQSPHPELRPLSQIYSLEIKETSSPNLKKSTKNSPSQKLNQDYINELLENDLEYSNDVIRDIILHYNKYTNKINNIDYFISSTNKILFDYTNKTNTTSKINNIYDAYNYVFLCNIVSFWIFFKFMIDSSEYYINVYYLQNHLAEYNIYINSTEILKMELKILKAIDYNILRFI